MFDAFNSAGSIKVHRRFAKKSRAFSPSFGVRRGLIRDPHWPPANAPDGTSPRRTSLRVACTFQVEAGRSNPVTVTGNLSAGGAMFVSKQSLGDDKVVVIAGPKGEVRALAQVLGRREEPGTGIIHHVRFLDANEAARVRALVDRLDQ